MGISKGCYETVNQTLEEEHPVKGTSELLCCGTVFVVVVASSSAFSHSLVGVEFVCLLLSKSCRKPKQ